MAKRYKREGIIARLKNSLKQGKPIILGGAGDGFTAKLEEKGGLDIIGVYNSGRFRHYGAGSLSGLMPVGRNNEMVLEYAPEVCSMVKETPVIAGFCSQDSRMIWDHWCKQLWDIGVSGFMSFPTVGLIDADSKYRKNLEESGLGFSKEACAIPDAVSRPPSDHPGCSQLVIISSALSNAGRHWRASSRRSGDFHGRGGGSGGRGGCGGRR